MSAPVLKAHFTFFQAPVLTGPATSNPITDDTLGDFHLGTFTCTDLDTVLTFTVLPTTGPYEARPVVPATVPASTYYKTL